MARFRLARPAQIDLANILATSAERWRKDRSLDRDNLKMNLQMKREALQKLNRAASEAGVSRQAG